MRNSKRKINTIGMLYEFSSWINFFAIYGSPKGLTFSIEVERDRDNNYSHIAKKINKNGILTVDVTCRYTNEVFKTYRLKADNLMVKSSRLITKELMPKITEVNKLIGLYNDNKISLLDLYKKSNKL